MAIDKVVLFQNHRLWNQFISFHFSHLNDKKVHILLKIPGDDVDLRGADLSGSLFLSH